MSPERSLIARVIDRPIAILMLFLSLVGTGVIAYTRIPVNLLPEGFSSNFVSILIPSPNSSPLENEDKITKPVEEVVRSIPGIKEVRSLSGDFGSRINVEFSSRADIDLAYMEVKDRIERVKHNFPENVDRYYCFRFNMDTDLPLLAMAVMYGDEVQRPGALAEDVVKSRLEGVDGVAEVNVEGLVDEAVRVFLDPGKVEGHKANLYNLVRRMATDNFALPAGRIVDGQRRYNLRIDAHYRNLEEVERYPVTPDLEIRDLGEVVRGRRYRDHVVRINGKDGLFLFISKESQKNTVEVCSAVERELEALKSDPRLKDFEFLVFFNQKKMIESSLRVLKTSMAWGGLFALIVLFVFLRHVRATLIVALAIPMSILMALVAVYFTGHTINILSLSGFTLAVGMLVDNAIVVTENIFRRRAEGLSPADASARGAGEVGTAIVMATLTTIIVFLPLIFLQEDQEIRLVLGEIGLPISFSLIASLFSALAFIPLAATYLIWKGKKRKERKGAPFLMAYRGKGRAARLYEGGMRWVLDHRFGAALIALILLSTNQAASRLTDRALQESSEGGGVTVQVELPTHFTIDEADSVFRKLEAAGTAKGEKFKTKALVSIFNRRSGRLVFYPRDDADTRFRKELPKLIMESLPLLPGVRYDMRVENSNETRKEFRVEISGPDSGLLAEIAFDLKERLGKIPEITNVRTDIEKGNDEVRVKVNREMAAQFNVDPQVLRGVVAWGLGGQRLPDYVADGGEIRMQLEYEEKPTESLETIRNMAIPTAGGARLPLASVARLSVTKGPAVIQRQDGRTTMGITATPLTDNVYTVSRKVARVMENYSFPHDYSWVEKGGTATFEEKAREIEKAFAMSVILVFILMGILFESFTLPLTVLVSIPFSILGGMWLLCVTGLPLDVNGMVGFILLAGIVVNNAIVLIDHINRLRREGLDRREAVIRGGKERLRPIFMTALTTISGLLPMATPTLFASDEGGGVFSYRTLAVVVLGGLALSTLFTVFVVPLAYTLLDDLGAVLKEVLLAPLLKRKPGPGNQAGC